MPCNPTWCRCQDNRDFHKAQVVKAILWECPSKWTPLSNNNNSCKCSKWMPKAFSRAILDSLVDLLKEVNQDNLKLLKADSQASNTELNQVSIRDLLKTWEDNQCQVCWEACLMQSLIKWTSLDLCREDKIILVPLESRDLENQCTPFILVIWLTLFSNSIFLSSSKLRDISSGMLESCLTKIQDQRDLDILTSTMLKSLRDA